MAVIRNFILDNTKDDEVLMLDDNILLIDEIHTPNSSRYWLSDNYKERFNKNKEPENIDKEFLRLWFRDNCDPYNDAELPPAPDDLVIELSCRYIQLYECLVRCLL